MAGLSEVFNLDLSKTLADFDKINAKLSEAQDNYAKARKSAFSTTETLHAQRIEVEALQKEYNTIKTALVNTTIAEQNLSKASIENVKSGKAELNSVEENRKARNALYNEYLRLPRATEAQREKADELGKTIGNLSNVLKEQEGLAGNYSRNVGNYFKEIQIGGVSINGLSSGLKAAKEAFTSGETGAKAFGLALKATGIGLFVAAVGALIAVFKDFAPVADFVENIIGTISTTVSKLILHLQNLDFSAAFGDITGITDTYKAVSDLNEATRQLEDSEGAYINLQAKLRGEVEKNLLASRNVNASYDERIDAVNKANKAEQKAFDEQRKRQQQQVDAAKKALINITGNYDELDAELKAYTDGQSEFFDSIVGGNESAKEALKKYAEEKSKLTDIDNEQGKLEERLAQRREQITEKEQARIAQVTAKREADNAKAKAALERLQKAYEDYYLNLEKLQSKYLDTEEQQLYDSFQADLDAIKGQSEQEVALRISIENKRAKAIAKLRKDNTEKLNTDTLNAEMAHLEAIKQLELNDIANSKNTAEKKTKLQLDVELKYLSEKLKIAQQLSLVDGQQTQAELDNIALIEQAISHLRKEIEKPTDKLKLLISKEDLDKSNEIGGALQNGLSAVSQSVTAFYQDKENSIDAAYNAEVSAIENSTLSEEEKQVKLRELDKKTAQQKYELEKKQFEANKAMAIVQAVINTALAVVNAFATTPFPASIVMAALAAAVGAANIAVIATQPPPAPPKFAKGIIGIDGPGTYTSDSIPAYLSKGETVVSAKATPLVAKQIADAERMVGNKPNFGGHIYGGKFANGIIGIGDGGYVSRSITRDAENRATAQIITDALRAMPQPKVSVVEINEVDARRQAAIKVGS